MLKSSPLISYYVTVFGEKVYKRQLKLTEIIWVGPDLICLDTDMHGGRSCEDKGRNQIFIKPKTGILE